MTKHPTLLPTLFRCLNCGTEHRIMSTLGGDKTVEACSVCSLPGSGPVARGDRVAKFRLRQAKARAAKR